MKKFPKLKRIGDSVNDGILESADRNIYVQEKLDGANFRFVYDRDTDRLVFGSRNVEYWNDGNQPITKRDRRWFRANRYLNRLPLVSNRPTSPQNDVDKRFRHAMEYVSDVVDLDVIQRLDHQYGQLTFFGEAMHSHTIDYEWEETPSFVGFSVYSGVRDEFVTGELMEDLFSQLGLPTAKRHDLDVVQDGFDCPESEYYDGPAEGVVVKNDDTGQVAKIRGQAFKEVAQNLSPVDDEGNAEPPDSKVLANQFATEMRILKMIHKYEDRGRDVEMAMMEDLWRDVFEDVIEEEFETIFLGNHSINTKDFRSEVASNTATVLQRYLNRPDDSVLNEVPA